LGSFSLFLLFNACASTKEKKDPNAEQITKELRKQKKKDIKAARKANERAKKEFWDKQTPEMKRRIKESNRRMREQRKLRKKVRNL
jgi:gas vesicle protein